MSEATAASVPRRQQILEALAQELERAPGERITTAQLARAVGVSEAALYRHFPSKARMFEELIGFAEETVFGRIALILAERRSALERCGQILALLLTFGERNAGITRVLLGDALVGETPRLRERGEQFFRRLETQLRQVLREGSLHGELQPGQPVGAQAALLTAVVTGRLQRYAQGGFAERPTAEWEAQWQLLHAGLRAGALT